MKTKAAVLYETGAPQPFAESLPLVVDEITLAGPGPGEVLVEIVGAGLCHSDLSVVDGSRPRPLPMVLGHEASGIVREVGAADSSAAEFAPGDHVVFSWVPVCGRCLYCASGRGAMCEPGNAANLVGTLLSGARRFTDSRSNPQACSHHLGVSAFSQFTVAAQESLVKIDPFASASHGRALRLRGDDGCGSSGQHRRRPTGNVGRGIWDGRRWAQRGDGRTRGGRLSDHCRGPG